MRKRMKLLFNAVRYTRLRFLFAGIAAFALGSAVYTLISYIGMENVEISEAYASLGAMETEGVTEVTARLDGFMSQGDKQRIVRFVASGLGITTDDEPEYTEDEEGSRAVLVFRNSHSTTTLCLASLNDDTCAAGQRHYLLARINIKADENYDVIYYRERLREIFTELEGTVQDTSLLLSGSLDGRMTNEEKNDTVEKVCDRLGGKIVLESKTDDVYTIYLYTSAIEDYVEAGGERINVQVVIKYDRAGEKTLVSIATPIMNSDW